MKNLFSPTVLKKDITRFAPLWGLYAVFMLMFLLLWWEMEGDAARFANSAAGIMTGMGILNLCYAGIAALVLFGDLFKTRMCNMLHAMPVRREGWFVTHCVAGLLFCIVPNTLGALIAAAILGQYAYLAFLWLGLMVLQYLFFFGLGVFSAMCAGNGLGAVAVYTIVNFLAPLASWLIKIFYEPFLYGVQIKLQTISRFAPVILFSDSEYVQTHYDNMTETTVLDRIDAGAWIYLGVAAAVGVALAVAALFIYRKRALESAGDMISLKPVAPVFLVIYTLFVGAVLFYVAESVTGVLGYLFLAVGLAIGFFTGKMLLEKRVNVFSGKNFLFFGIFVAVFVATVGLTVLDPAGITRFVPQADQVESVTVSPYNSVYSIYNQSCLLDAPEDVQTIVALHADAITNRPDANQATLPVNLIYKLKNGGTLERQYQLPETTEYKNLLQGFYSRPESVLGTADVEELLGDLWVLECHTYEETTPYIYITNQQSPLPYIDDKFELEPVVIQFEGSFADQSVARGLVEAIYADCLAGNMSQWWNEAESVGYVGLQMTQSHYNYRDITIYDSCENTINYLKSLQPATP